MLAMTGFLQRSSSFQIRSLAKAEPPGLSTRSTIALTVLSFSAWRMASMHRAANRTIASPEQALAALARVDDARRRK